MGDLWKKTHFLPFSRMSENWCMFISDEGKGLSQMKWKWFWCCHYSMSSDKIVSFSFSLRHTNSHTWKNKLRKRYADGSTILVLLLVPRLSFFMLNFQKFSLAENWALYKQHNYSERNLNLCLPQFYFWLCITYNLYLRIQDSLTSHAIKKELLLSMQWSDGYKHVIELKCARAVSNTICLFCTCTWIHKSFR